MLQHLFYSILFYFGHSICYICHSILFIFYSILYSILYSYYIKLNYAIARHVDVRASIRVPHACSSAMFALGVSSRHHEEILSLKPVGKRLDDAVIVTVPSGVVGATVRLCVAV